MEIEGEREGEKGRVKEVKEGRTKTVEGETQGGRGRGRGKKEREKEREGDIYKVTHQPLNQDHKSQKTFSL